MTSTPRSTHDRKPSMRRPGNGPAPVAAPTLDILHEDADIIVVAKPAGQIVHPAPGHTEGALTDELVAHCPALANVGSRERPGIVHRLDIDTSGVMVVAKTPRAYTRLRRDFEDHASIEKTYLAVLHGAPTPPSGTLETLIGRKAWDAHRMASYPPGAAAPKDAKPAVTHWTLLQRHGPLALVEFRIDTGRTHQIRVHAALLGHPIVGDALYGDAEKDRRLRHRPTRQLLHAVGLAFNHPVTGKRLEFFAEPPADILYAQ